MYATAAPDVGHEGFDIGRSSLFFTHGTTAGELLVRVLHITLMMLGQGFHDDAIGLVHRGLHTQAFALCGHNGLVYHQTHGVAVHKIETGHAREHIKGAVDGHGHHGQADVVGQLESPLAEQPHVPGEGATALGEDHQRSAVFQRAACAVDGVLYGFRARLVYKDETGFLASVTHERNFAQRLLHHPLEVAMQITVYQKNVHRALMIGHEDIALSGLQVLASLHLDRQQQHVAENLRPNAAGPIPPEMGTEQHAAHTGRDGRQCGGYKENGECNEKLIDFVKDFHDNYL